jgi:hypothetical protein
MLRETVQGFDYKKKTSERFEIPLDERIAAIRARRAGERARHKENKEKGESRRNSTIFGFSKGKGTSLRKSSLQERSH